MNAFVRRGLLPFLALSLLLGACAPPSSRPDRLSFAPLEFEIPKIERLVLPNGIRVYLREDHELPLVEISAMVGSGTLAEPDGKSGLADLFADLLRTGGAGRLGPDAFEQRLEQMAADLEVSADTYATTVDFSLRSADLREGLAVLDDLLRRPGFDGRRFELARRQAIEMVRRQDDDPASVAARALKRALYGRHPLGRTPTVASLRAVTRDDLVQLHEKSIRPGNLWLGVSGDFDRAALSRMLGDLWGDWRPGPAAAQNIPPLTGGEPAAVWVAEKDIPQTTVLLGEIGVDKDNPDLPALRVMNFILGGGGFNSRMLREVRSNRGLAYSVYSHYEVGRWLPGPFMVGCETKSESTAAVVGLLRKLMAEMRTAAVSDEELRLAKESLINSFVFAFTDSHEVVAQRMRIDYYHYPEDYLRSYRDRIAAVTADDVLRVAKTYLHPEGQSLVLVGRSAAFDAPPETFGLPVRAVPRQAR